jgi:ATP-dependent RNA helicase DeaD
MTEFEGAVPALAQALSKRGYETFTPVQNAVLVPGLAGVDMLVSAQTGSGKTVAFGLSLAPTLLDGAARFTTAPAPLALVVAPTRELALQVKRELEWLYAMTGAAIASCVGGMDMRTERRVLQRGAHIVVGTPGRLRDHIERGSLDTSAFKAVVLDEADEMLDLGFRDDLEYILDAAPAKRRTLMFSATVPRAIATLAKKYQRDAVRVSTEAERGQHEDIEYRALTVAPNDRENAIVNVLRYYEATNALVFCATRATVNRMTSRFTNRGFAVVALSGELSQNERTHALQAMRDGRARVCIATDVAARGIDLPNLELVVHADLPRNREALLHRSGRTGRAGRKGVCALIVPYNERRRTERLLQFANVKAEWAKPPSIDDIARRDQERILEDPALTEPVSESEQAFTKDLLERHGPEQIAAAFLRLYAKDRTAPEELIDNGPPDRKPKRRDDFENGVWFSLSVGSKHHAEARWIVPMLCRAGHLTKRDIGAIRVQQAETHVEFAPDCVEKLLEAIGPAGMVEKTVSLKRLERPPAASERKPYAGTPRHADRGPKPRGGFEPTRKPEQKPRDDAPAPRRTPAAKPTPPPETKPARDTAEPRAEKPQTKKPVPAPRQAEARTASDPKPNYERKPRTPRADDGNPKKGWAKAKPKNKKPGKLKLGDKPQRNAAKSSPKGRAADNAGFAPLRRKKPKKKTVTVIAREKKTE